MTHLVKLLLAGAVATCCGCKQPQKTSASDHCRTIFEYLEYSEHKKARDYYWAIQASLRPQVDARLRQLLLTQGGIPHWIELGRMGIASPSTFVRACKEAKAEVLRACLLGYPAGAEGWHGGLPVLRRRRSTGDWNDPLEKALWGALPPPGDYRDWDRDTRLELHSLIVDRLRKGSPAAQNLVVQVAFLAFDVRELLGKDFREAISLTSEPPEGKMSPSGFGEWLISHRDELLRRPAPSPARAFPRTGSAPSLPPGFQGL